MHVVILAGGYGSRLGDLTKAHPKYLVPVAGKPFCDWQLDLLTRQGFTSFTVCLGYRGAQIRAHLDYHWRDLDVSYSDEGLDQQGPWVAYARAKHRLPSRHAVIYGDSYLDLPVDLIRACWASPKNVYLRWGGEDYGLRFLGGRGVENVDAPAPWHEVGSREGIANLEAHLTMADA